MRYNVCMLACMQYRIVLYTQPIYMRDLFNASWPWCTLSSRWGPACWPRVENRTGRSRSAPNSYYSQSGTPADCRRPRQTWKPSLTGIVRTVVVPDPACIVPTHRRSRMMCTAPSLCPAHRYPSWQHALPLSPSPFLLPSGMPWGCPYPAIASGSHLRLSSCHLPKEVEVNVPHEAVLIPASTYVHCPHKHINKRTLNNRHVKSIIFATQVCSPVPLILMFWIITRSKKHIFQL